MKTEKQVLINRGEVILFLLICIGILSFFISPASAGQTTNSSVNITKITDTSISFEVFYKTTVRATGATFDGIEIEGFDLLHNVTYTAKGLEPNTTHTFCIYKDLINCETGTTTYPKSTDLINAISPYLLFIFGCIIVIIGIKVPFIAFIAWIIALAGIKLNTGGDFNINIAYIILILAAAFVGFMKMKEGE